MVTAGRLVLLALLTCSYAAFAGEPDPNSMFNKALELAKRGKTDKAVEIWQNVLEKVEPRYRPSVHKALGMGYGKMGRLPEAAFHVRRFLESQMEAEAQSTREKLAAIEERLATTHRKRTIGCKPSQAFVYVGLGENEVPYSCPLTWWFKKGKHEIQVSKVGYRPETAVVDATEESLQELVTVVLQPAGDSGPPEKKLAEMAHRVKLAAKAGHMSVVRRMALKHPEVFRELDCDSGWNAAMTSVKRGKCMTDMMETLVSTGTRKCVRQKDLRKAISLGCASLTKMFLAYLEDDAISAAAYGWSAVGNHSATAEDIIGMLRSVDLLRERLEAPCGKAPESAPCKALGRLEEEVTALIRQVAKTSEPQDIVRVFAEYPELARMHHCSMVYNVVHASSVGGQCQKNTERLKKFFQPGPLECEMSRALSTLVRVNCISLLEMVTPYVVTEDLVDAAWRYNDNDFFMPDLLNEQKDLRFQWAEESGKVLIANAKSRCRKDGGESPACEAVRRVENELLRIRTELKRQSGKKFLKAELCRWQEALDSNMMKLAKIKRRHNLAGLTTHPEISIQADHVVNCESAIERLSHMYKKTTRRTFKPSICR